MTISERNIVAKWPEPGDKRDLASAKYVPRVVVTAAGDKGNDLLFLGPLVQAFLGNPESVEVKIDTKASELTITPNGQYILMGEPSRHGNYLRVPDIRVMPRGTYAPLPERPNTYRWAKPPMVRRRKRV